MLIFFIHIYVLSFLPFIFILQYYSLDLQHGKVFLHIIFYKILYYFLRMCHFICDMWYCYESHAQTIFKSSDVTFWNVRRVIHIYWNTRLTCNFVVIFNWKWTLIFYIWYWRSLYYVRIPSSSRTNNRFIVRNTRKYVAWEALWW